MCVCVRARARSSACVDEESPSLGKRRRLFASPTDARRGAHAPPCRGAPTVSLPSRRALTRRASRGRGHAAALLRVGRHARPHGARGRAAAVARGMASQRDDRLLSTTHASLPPPEGRAAQALLVRGRRLVARRHVLAGACARRRGVVSVGSLVAEMSCRRARARCRDVARSGEGGGAAGLYSRSRRRARSQVTRRRSPLGRPHTLGGASSARDRASSRADGQSVVSADRSGRRRGGVRGWRGRALLRTTTPGSRAPRTPWRHRCATASRSRRRWG